MTLYPASTFSTRALSLLMIAAFAGIGLWLFLPTGGGNTLGVQGSGGDSLPPSLRVSAQPSVETQGDVVTGLIVPIEVRGDEGISLEGNLVLRAETAMSDTAAAAVPATFTLDWLDGNGDTTLDPGEHAVLTVRLPERTSVHPDNPLRLVLKRDDGALLAIEDVLP